MYPGESGCISIGQAIIIEAKIVRSLSDSFIQTQAKSIVGVSLMHNHKLWVTSKKQSYESDSVSLS